MPVHRILLGLLLCCAALPGASAGEDAFARDLVGAREEAYVAPSAALRKLDALQAGRSGTALGEVLIEKSRAYFWLGEKAKSIDSALRAERLGRAGHDDTLVAKALLARSYTLSMLVHDQETARRLIEQAASLAAGGHDIHLQTRALVTQGLLAQEDGRMIDARDFLVRAVALARAGGDQDALGMALRERASLLAAEEHYDQALALTDEMVRLARTRRIPAQLARARLAEYAIAARAGRARRAESALLAAIELLEKLQARESLAVPLANLAELYIQARRFGEAARMAQAALKIARDLGDGYAAHLASFQLGMTDIYFRNIGEGRATVDKALESLKDDDRYLRMLLDYGHALNQVGDGDAALTVYRKAGSVSLAAWHKERKLAYETLERAYANQKKQAEVAALRHESALKAADLENTRRQRSLWVAFSATTMLAVLAIAMLLRRVRKTNRLLHQKNEQLFLQSTRDSLTGLFNRHYFYQEVVPRYHDDELGAGGMFLLLDIDHFKSINDRFGHAAGDTVLKHVAARLTSVLRDEDILIRWGGEEFLAYLPGAGANEARRVCARLLDTVGAKPIALDTQTITVTTSIGFCPRPKGEGQDPEPGWETLVHLADLCLYLAKTAGRNQAFGVGDACALSPDAIARADADLKQASLDGAVELLNVKNA